MSNMGDPYNAPHSVPTPSKSAASLTNNPAAGQHEDYHSSIVNNLNNSYENASKPIAQSFRTKPSSSNPKVPTKPLSKLGKILSLEAKQRYFMMF